MKKILFMGTADLVFEMIDYAKSQGAYTIVTDYNPPEKSLAKLYSDEYWMISLSDLDLLEQKCREEGVTAVTCGISEYYQDQTNELCERLGLPCYCNAEAWHFNRNKADFKEACKRVGLPIATDYILSDELTDEELAEIQYPVVTKPVDKLYNLGVSFCHNKEELIEGYRYAQSVSDNPRIIVERMITGREVLGYYALAEGEARLLGVTCDYTPSQDPDAGYCYTVNMNATDSTAKFIKKTDAYAKKLLKEIGCREGFAWIQFFHDSTDDNFYAIEMGYRLAGDFVYVGMEKINHFNVINWMVDYALGKKHTAAELPAEMTSAWKQCACTYLIWTGREGTIGSIQGMEEVAKLPIALPYRFQKPGIHMDKHKILFGAIFAAEDCDQMCEMIQKINDTLFIYDEEGNDMLLKFHDFDRIKADYARGLEN